MHNQAQQNEVEEDKVRLISQRCTKREKQDNLGARTQAKQKKKRLG